MDGSWVLGVVDRVHAGVLRRWRIGVHGSQWRRRWSARIRVYRGHEAAHDGEERFPVHGESVFVAVTS